MIFHEYSLIFFTVLAQTAVGGYLLVSARALVKGYDEEKIHSASASTARSSWLFRP